MNRRKKTLTRNAKPIFQMGSTTITKKIDEWLFYKDRKCSVFIKRAALNHTVSAN